MSVETEFEGRHWWQMVKPNQGRYVRGGTAIGVGLVDLALAYYLWLMLERHVPGSLSVKVYLMYALPAAFFLGVGAAAAYFMNRPGAVDFLIATESEMKKVSWSNKAELFGSTFVVIMTVLLMAVFIFIADLIFTGGMAEGWTIPYTGIHIPGLGLW